MGRVTAPFAACFVVEGLVPAADLRNVELLVMDLELISLSEEME